MDILEVRYDVVSQIIMPILPKGIVVYESSKYRFSPLHLKLVPSIHLDPVNDVALNDRFAYLADGYSGLRIFDVSNPTHPFEVGCYDTPGYVSQVTVVHPYAYVIDGCEGVRIIDISNSSLPQETGFFATPNYPRGVAVAGSYAYVIENQSLHIVYVGNLQRRVKLGLWIFANASLQYRCCRQLCLCGV